jgi:NAD(P)-dependent dehydrogenase (short-subunit alcohol dehydrogenase family)
LRRSVLVVTGVGSMGLAAVRRLGGGRRILLADVSQSRLEAAAAALQNDGHEVSTQVMSVGDATAVHQLAEQAAKLGLIEVIVHTAGVSPSSGDARQIYKVNLLGTALVIDAFAVLASERTALVAISSMAAYRAPVPKDVETALATVPTADLLALPAVDLDSADSSYAYHLSKRGAQLRVRAAAASWGKVGARINSISPGIIATSMTKWDFEGAKGDMMRRAVASSPVARIGTSEDVAAAIAFLVSDDASFITGTDLLVDGGVAATNPW